MLIFSFSHLLVLVFVFATAFGLGGCATTTFTRDDGTTVSTTTVDPCLSRTVGGAVTGAVLGAAIGDTRHSAVNGSIAGSVLSSGQGCGNHQQVSARAISAQPVVTYVNTGIRITKVDCQAGGGIWGQDANGANVCVGQSQLQNHHHRPVVSRPMCLYNVGWGNGGGGTTQGLRNDQFSAPQSAGNKNLGPVLPGTRVSPGQMVEPC